MIGARATLNPVAAERSRPLAWTSPGFRRQPKIERSRLGRKLVGPQSRACAAVTVHTGTQASPAARVFGSVPQTISAIAKASRCYPWTIAASGRRRWAQLLLKQPSGALGKAQTPLLLTSDSRNRASATAPSARAWSAANEGRHLTLPSALNPDRTILGPPEPDLLVKFMLQRLLELCD
ncbi:MAG: hypothetical protein JWO57_4063 [Pseudonocardiales bacterium]|nr:hypothetical protein [Pseudonocardiales bacterium]